MRKCIAAVLLAICSLTNSQVANAQSVSQDILLNATVPSYCTIGGSATTSPLGPYTIPVSATGVVNTTQINVPAIPNVVCNRAANFSFQSVSSGVTSGGPAPMGATNVIEYAAVANFGGATASYNTSTDSGSVGTTPNAVTDNLVVAITPLLPTLPLAPGNYTDTLIVTLSPTP